MTSGSAGRRPGRPRDPDVDRRVLDAALDLVADRGTGALRLEAVAERAGVARSTVYRRFPSVPALLLALNEVGSTLPAPVVDTGDPDHDLEEMAWTSAVELLDPRARRVVAELVGARAGDPGLDDRVREQWRERRASTRAVLERAVTAGTLPPSTDPDLVLDLISGLVYFRLLVRGAPVDRDVVSRAVALLLAGLRATPNPGQHAPGADA